jgi:hypothetical protein
LQTTFAIRCKTIAEPSLSMSQRLYQKNAYGEFVTREGRCLKPESNRPPTHYECAALPNELFRQKKAIVILAKIPPFPLLLSKRMCEARVHRAGGKGLYLCTLKRQMAVVQTLKPKMLSILGL